ncbi:hypothetical protein KSX_67820 [Ktedonospora formicarum]|uniref:ISKra4 family transposase n=2 Tax=Ktedonospora formicarum TaxID=2778364 RepID=A0A8J3IAS5_9CHLR|nr:hypothetical protein KSX_67820 [Ktedonospora formicarum]
MLGDLLGVQVSTETARRLTEQMGAWMDVAQTEASLAPPSETRKDVPAPKLRVVSADGAMISLVHKQWVEVRTVAIGESVSKPDPNRKPATQEIHVDHLSYFSHLSGAATFTALAKGEMQRRKVAQATQVCAVTDGAEWCQAFAERYRPDAVRILDFPHAAEHVSALLEGCTQAGIQLPDQMLSRCLHVLKHRGPRPLLRMANHLGSDLLQQKGIQEHLDYLRKREPLMQYPTFREHGWPIGSGMVESANKLVVQARLKGSGMHWQRDHVNPMLALRNAVCNERWQEMWRKALTKALKQAYLSREPCCESQPQSRSRSFRLRDRSCLPEPSSPSLLSSTASQELAPPVSSLETTAPVVVSHETHLPSRERSCRPGRSLAASSSQRLGQDTCLCGGPLRRQKGHRPKRYCSGRCRQRAYRERQGHIMRRMTPLPLVPPTRHSRSMHPCGRRQQKKKERSVPKRVNDLFHRAGGVQGETCLFCGAELVQLRGRRRGGRQRAYCSGRCRQRAYRERTA